MIKKIVLTAIAIVSFLSVDAQAAISEDIVKEKTVAVPSNTEVKKDVVPTIPSEKIFQQVKMILNAVQ